MIIGYSRKFNSAALPTTGMTMHFDFSDISTLYKTYNGGSDPSYASVASADGDTIEVARSVFPVSTSDWTAHYTDATSSKSPLLRSSSPGLGTQCLDFDGSNDRYVIANRIGTSFKTAGDIFSASARTILLAFRCESLPGSPSTYQPLLADSSGSFWWGLYVYNNGGTVQILHQNHDGSYDSLFGATVAANTNYTVMARHESGNLYVSLNGGSESSLASGNLSTTSGGFYIAGGSDGSVFNGRIGEIATWNVALTGTDLSDAITYFTTKWA